MNCRTEKTSQGVCPGKSFRLRLTFKPKSEGRFLLHSKYHHRIARLCEEKDWNGKAIEHYEKLLTMGKDSDLGIADVEDARKRQAGLR